MFNKSPRPVIDILPCLGIGISIPMGVGRGGGRVQTTLKFKTFFCKYGIVLGTIVWYVLIWFTNLVG